MQAGSEYRNGMRPHGAYPMLVLTLICCHAFGVTIDVDPSGSLKTLGRTFQANLLGQPVRMRLLERQFREKEATEQVKTTTQKVVVANQLFDGAAPATVKRSVSLVIDAGSIAGTVDLEAGVVTVTKSDAEAQLHWTSVYTPVAGGVEIAVRFENKADRLRSFDVEMAIALAGTDYEAFFPAANDFPEWPPGAALAYQLRANQWDYNRLSQPLATFFSKQRNVGLSVASSYARPILPITFFAARSKDSTAILATFVRVRLDPNGERTIRLYLAPHAGDWRCGLAFVRETFPGAFYVNPAVSQFFTHSFGGSGALGGYYPECMNNPRQWQNYMWSTNPWHRMVIEMMGLQRWFGQYMSDVPQWTPDVAGKWYFVNKTPERYPKEFLEGKPPADAHWRRIVEWIESRPEQFKEEIFKKGRDAGIGPSEYYWYKVTKDKVRQFIRIAREHNTSMFLYWNPRDVWYPYAKDKFEDLVVYHSKDYFNTDNAYVSAAKGSDFFNWHLGQIRSMFQEYPQLDGFFVDQCYGAANDVYDYDDGYSVTDDGRTASCFNSNLAELTAAGRKIAHEQGKFVWGNHCQEMIDIVANYDLALCEGRMTPGLGQEISRYSTIGNRPCMSLSYGEGPAQSCLRAGFSSSIFRFVADGDDYDTRFSKQSFDWISRLYAPMFDLFRSKTWVLEPHCLTLPDGFDGNLFRIDDEQNLLATVVAFGESFSTPWLRLDVPVTVRTSDVDQVKAAYVVGAANLGAVKVPFERDGDSITVKIPQFRGAAAVVLAKAGQFVSVDSLLPTVSPGGTFTFNLVADNFTDQTWSWKNTVWLGRKRDWHWEEVPSGHSVSKPFRITVPTNASKPFVQMRLAKDVPSRLPIEDGAANHDATFEFAVGPAVSATVSPSRKLVGRTISNTQQGGYKPFHAAYPLHIYEGETAEFTLGIANTASQSQRLSAEISGKNIEIIDLPNLMHVPPLSQRNFSVAVRGAQRGDGSLHLQLKKGDQIVSSFDLPIRVFATSLVEADLADIKSASLLYDLWGTTRTSGADAKDILVNGVPAGPLVVSGGYPAWMRSTRAKLNAEAAKAIKTTNVISISNKGESFWKIRNVLLEVEMADGGVIHLKADPGAASFPASHPWAEGKRNDTNAALLLAVPAEAPPAAAAQPKPGKTLVKATVICAPLSPDMFAKQYKSDCPAFTQKGASSKEQSTQVEFVDYDADTVDGKSLRIATPKTDYSVWGYEAGTSPVSGEVWTMEIRFRASCGQDCRVIDAPNWVPVSFSFADGNGIYGGLAVGYSYNKEGDYPPGNVVWAYVAYRDPEKADHAADRRFVVLPGSQYHTYRLVATGKPHPEQPDRKELKVFVDGEYRFSLYGNRDGKPTLQWGHYRPAFGSSSWDYVRWNNSAAIEPGKQPTEKWWTGSYEGDEIRTEED